MSSDALAERIANALGKSKKTPGGYLCRCPCHDDREASLSIKISDTGKGLILNCFAGCSWQDIKAEIERMGLLEKRDKSPVKYDKYAGAKFYVYKDLVGNVLCRKVKLPDKKMWFERLENNQWLAGLSGMIVPLYNIQAVLAAELVYLCEGEKDAETLITRGLTATTNHAGAKSWAAHLTDQLKGKTVIIIPDNDEAGKKRVQILSKALQSSAKELRVFIPDNVPEHGDITDWVNNGNDVNEILKRSVAVQAKAPSKKAPIEDYFELFEEIWNNPRRCMFSRKLMMWDSSEELWNPCINSIELVKSRALVLNESREAKFVMSAIETHFFAFEASKPCELLVDIPEWDGEDRISAMAYLVKLKPEAGVTDVAFSELLKEWCSLVFQRLHNPKIQNRILILQGAQGIGKDTWTDMLVDGLGQFCVPLNVVGNDKDTFLSLHDGLVMKISEYDKTSKTEVSTLKDMITAPKTMLRGAYERDRRLRLSRCSFISSANVKDLLRDSTGSRRYLIVEIESIEYAYAGWTAEQVHHWQMQCLAEMKHLGEVKYTASADSWRQMREYLECKTPVDMAVDAVEVFNRRLRQDATIAAGNAEVRISPNDERAVSLVAAIAKDFGVKPRTIKSMISSEVLVQCKIGASRPRLWVLPPLSSEEREQVGNTFQNSEQSEFQL